MKIYGEIIRRDEYAHYRVGDSLYTPKEIKEYNIVGRKVATRCIVGCSGKANQLLHPEIIGTASYGRVDDVMSWGYEGRGSDLMAAYLIANAFLGRYIGEDRLAKVDPGIVDIIQRYHKQFSTEVIANLPDEWEMDTEWIRQWVMEREKMEVKT